MYTEETEAILLHLKMRKARQHLEQKYGSGDTQAHQQMMNATEEHRKSFTPDEQKAMQAYAGPDSENVAKGLQDNTGNTVTQGHAQGLQGAALRGMSPDGTVIQMKADPAVFPTMANKIGSTMTMNRLSSGMATKSAPIGLPSPDDIHLHVKMAGGTPSAYVAEHTQQPEMMLPHGAQLRVDGVHQAPDGTKSAQLTYTGVADPTAQQTEHQADVPPHPKAATPFHRAKITTGDMSWSGAAAPDGQGGVNGNSADTVA